ncbi:MAG: protein kinase [Syntrophobacteraceae bacterium]
MPARSSYQIVLVGVEGPETDIIQRLLSETDFQIGLSAAAGIEDAVPFLGNPGILLVVLQVGEQRKRADQDVRRIRRALKQPAPILVLLPPVHAVHVRQYLRAGADEYWILPLDPQAFPPRLLVLLEWGHSTLEDTAREGSPRTWVRQIVEGLTGSVKRGLRRLAALAQGRQEVCRSELSMLAGKWEKLRRLGFGSYSEVWLVRESETERIAVAKIPHTQKMNTKFLREGAILKRLANHPNAVQLMEVVKEDDKVILIQEYVEGSTLQDLFNKGMDAPLKERAFLDLLEVLAYAHAQKIMHRDVKPENIIVTHEGTLKLLDFGTGKDLTRRSISNTVIGSRPYMAPEQIMGNSRLSSDVWASGVILFALATGCLPFYDDNEKQLMDLILEASPEKPRNLEPELSETLEGIILRCLQKDWTLRYPTAIELREDLTRQCPGFGGGVWLPAT